MTTAEEEKPEPAKCWNCQEDNTHTYPRSNLCRLCGAILNPKPERINFKVGQWYHIDNIERTRDLIRKNKPGCHYVDE